MSRPGGVVIGGDFQGLGIVRSLGRRGIPVCVIDDERSISQYSRYTTHAARVDDLRDDARALQALTDAGRRFGLDGWVLFPTRDETVALLARCRDQLADQFRVPSAPWSAIEQAWDKRRTYRAGQELGIPVPRTWYPASDAELQEIDGKPPFVVKPAIHERFVRRTKAKAWRAESMEDLRRLFRRASRIVGVEEVMVQEFIPGDGRHQYSYCAFWKDGRAIGLMLARRRRQHPADFGRASTYVETIENPAIEKLSERFLTAIGYYGLVEVEFKFDPRSGQYKLLDVNARTWGYHTLGKAAGVDFPYLLYADQLGERVEHVRARPGVHWVRMMTDVPSAALEVVHGRLSPIGYAQSLARAQAEAVLARDDPLPAVAELALLPYLAARRGF